MTNEKLKEVTALKQQIDSIKLLIGSLEERNAVIDIKVSRMILRVIPIFNINTSIYCDPELTEKICNLLKEHLKELEKRYKEF